MKQCPHCGTQYGDAHGFCSLDGSRLENAAPTKAMLIAEYNSNRETQVAQVESANSNTPNSNTKVPDATLVRENPGSKDLENPTSKSLLNRMLASRNSTGETFARESAASESATSKTVTGEITTSEPTLKIEIPIEASPMEKANAAYAHAATLEQQRQQHAPNAARRFIFPAIIAAAALGLFAFMFINRSATSEPANPNAARASNQTPLAVDAQAEAVQPLAQPSGAEETNLSVSSQANALNPNGQPTTGISAAGGAGGGGAAPGINSIPFTYVPFPEDAAINDQNLKGDAAVISSVGNANSNAGRNGNPVNSNSINGNTANFNAAPTTTTSPTNTNRAPVTDANNPTTRRSFGNSDAPASTTSAPPSNPAATTSSSPPKTAPAANAPASPTAPPRQTPLPTAPASSSPPDA